MGFLAKFIRAHTYSIKPTQTPRRTEFGQLFEVEHTETCREEIIDWHAEKVETPVFEMFSDEDLCISLSVFFKVFFMAP